MSSGKIFELSILNEHQYPLSIDVEGILTKCMLHLDQTNQTTLSVVFIDEQEMTQYNETYRGYANPTDVLSFPDSTIDPETGALYLGDILICYPFVHKQADSLKNNFVSELTLMLIHGLLHLLGYDHDTADAKNDMWTKQQQLLDMLGVSLNQIPE